MKIKFLLYILLASVALYPIYLIWKEKENDHSFECRAKLKTVMATRICKGYDMTSEFDFFLSMQGNQKGYMIVLGNYSCPNEPSKLVDGIVNLTYKKEGNYYSIQLGERSSEISATFKVLQYDKIKIKIKELENSEYMLSLPIETPILCKKD
ncbi:hypothetical protein ACUTQ5_20080 [Serratia sp. NA_112.1]|uniref:hypothetical protein n=1 Tax=unclassified Serratia (in: enterobacteria) TaxID=2647522 RepID=UPI004046CFCB